MRRLALVGFVLALLSAPDAASQQLEVIAELPRVGPAGALSTGSLAHGGPAFVVSVGPAAVNAWPVGLVSEPVVSALPDDAPRYWTPAFADFDADGFLDLAVSGESGIHLLRGDGTGRFERATLIATGSLDWELACGDFDGDGRADLVTVLASPVTSTAPDLGVYLSTGGLSFDAPRRTAMTTFGGVNALTAGDLDGDGRADVVVTPSQGNVSVWRSTGDGTFTLVDATLRGFYPKRARVIDVDADAHPEIVYLNAYRFPPFSVEVYTREPGDTFHELTAFQTASVALGPVFANLGDGRTSIVYFDVDGSMGPFLCAQTWVAGSFVTRRLDFRRAVWPASDDGYVPADWDGDGRDEYAVATTSGIEVLGLRGARTDAVAVPVLLSTTGLFGSRFDSDLLLTNSGTTPAHVALRYVASAGGGSGTVEREIPAGRQLFAPSAVAFLREAGLPISVEGNVFGTLRLEVSGASSPRAVSATVRTTTPAGAGVSYGGVPLLALLRSSSVVPWLTEGPTDRTNLAITNAGSDSDGPITLRVTVFSGVPGTEAPVTLPDVVLGPGAFYQLGRVLASAGLAASLGWARIVRVDGKAPYLAWATVNDSGSGDGSFVPAVDEDAELQGPWLVPNAVQTSRYGTELVVTNPGTEPLPLQMTLLATGTVLAETLAPRATLHLPDLFAEMRRRGLAGAPAADSDLVSPLAISGGSWRARLYAGIRVSRLPASSTSYGVFEPAVARGLLEGPTVVVPDLRQDAATRTNLGVVNLGPEQELRIDVFDGGTGALAGTTSRRLRRNELVQLDAILREVAPGVTRAWARVTPAFASTFAAYAILNDGAVPGAGIDDGSYVAGVPE